MPAAARPIIHPRKRQETPIMADPKYRFGSAAKTLTNTIAMLLDNALGTAITWDAQPVMFAGSHSW